MKESNKASPATLILMVLGIVVCVAFVVHGLMPDTPPPTTALSAAPSTSGAELPASPPVRDAGASTTASRAAGTTTVPTETGEKKATNSVTAGAQAQGKGPVFAAPRVGATEVTEADMAPDADPFTPIGGWKSASADSASPAAQTPNAPPRSAPAGLVQVQRTSPAALATFNVQEPELVGTLLGDKPSGVFRVDQRIVTIAQGAQVIGWKVVSIQQGAAVLQGMGRTLRLTTGKIGITAGAGKPTTSTTVGSDRSPDAVAASSNTLPTGPDAAGSGRISVYEVEVPSSQPEQSSLPRRIDNSRLTVDDSGTSNSVAVSGPFVHPASQLTGGTDTESERNSSKRGTPLRSNEPYPEPIQAPSEHRAGLAGVRSTYSASNPIRKAGPGPKPRRHGRHSRRHRRKHGRFATAHHHKLHHFKDIAIH